MMGDMAIFRRERDERDQERQRISVALGHLEVDSQWDAARLLDAISNAVAALNDDDHPRRAA